MTINVCQAERVWDKARKAALAEWAGHRVAVLHQIHAKVISGLGSAAHQRIEAALGWEGETREGMAGAMAPTPGPVESVTTTRCP